MIKEEPQLPRTEDEPRVVFRSISDRDVLRIYREDTEQTLAEISGYDLAISFNLKFINSVQDVEAVLEGLSELFRDAIMKQMLEDKNKQND